MKNRQLGLTCKKEKMIEVNHVSKEFVSPKKYPGLKGQLRGCFQTRRLLKLR